MRFGITRLARRTLYRQLSFLAVLVLVVTSAWATFPGTNGRIAFGRYNAAIDGWQLYTANPDGTDVQPLAFVSSLFSDWRADGKRIAFDFFDSDGNEQVATINPDGSNMQQITFGPGIHEVPSWSPSGTQIVFDYSPLLPDDPNFTTSIFVMNSEGSNPHAVTTGGFDVEPRFSPDGTRIAFSRIRKFAGNGFQQEAIFVVNADGSNLQQLTAWESPKSIHRGRPTHSGSSSTLQKRKRAVIRQEVISAST